MPLTKYYLVRQIKVHRKWWALANMVKFANLGSDKHPIEKGVQCRYARFAALASDFD